MAQHRNIYVRFIDTALWEETKLTRKIMRRRLLGVALLTLTAFAFVGCKDKNEGASGKEGGGNSATNTASGDTIVIGEYSSMTGGTSTFGQNTHKGITLAVDEINAAGGINGKKIKLVTEDDESKAEKVVAVVQKLISSDKVVAVLGEVASSRSMLAADVCQPAKTPMISPSSTNPKVTQKGDYIFRVCFTDDFQAVVAAHFAYDQGYRNVAVFKDVKNDYSTAFAEIFTKEFTKLGGKISGEQSYQEKDADFKAQLGNLKSGNPDAMLVPGYYNEVGTIARQAREAGMNIPLIGGDGWESPNLVPGAGTALEGCFFTNHSFSRDMPDPLIQKFVANYKKAYNEEPTALSGLAYDAAMVLATALKGAKTLDGAGIRDAIAGVKDYQGVTGKITIDANRNARKEAVVFQIKGNAFKIFKTYKPEQVGF